MNRDIVIRVEDIPGQTYFVHFNIEGELLAIQQYRQVYTPDMGVMSPRHKSVAALARSRVGSAVKPREH